MREYFQLVFNTTKGTTKTVNVHGIDPSVNPGGLNSAAGRIANANIFEGVTLTDIRQVNHIVIARNQLI